jgi:hypothetical protein
MLQNQTLNGLSVGVANDRLDVIYDVVRTRASSRPPPLPPAPPLTPLLPARCRQTRPRASV